MFLIVAIISPYSTLLLDHPFFHFSDEQDIALSLLTDGFAPFKQCDKMCWPVIIFNYNLPPNIRFQKKYCIHLLEFEFDEAALNQIDEGFKSWVQGYEQ